MPSPHPPSFSGHATALLQAAGLHVRRPYVHPVLTQRHRNARLNWIITIDTGIDDSGKVGLYYFQTNLDFILRHSDGVVVVKNGIKMNTSSKLTDGEAEVSSFGVE